MNLEISGLAKLELRALFDAIVIPVRVGFTESNVTLVPFDAAVTLLAAFPALSLIFVIAKATVPWVSPASIVRTAV